MFCRSYGTAQDSSGVKLSSPQPPAESAVRTFHRQFHATLTQCNYHQGQGVEARAAEQCSVGATCGCAPAYYALLMVRLVPVNSRSIIRQCPYASYARDTRNRAGSPSNA
jgi:hypothetical protein